MYFTAGKDFEVLCSFKPHHLDEKQIPEHCHKHSRIEVD